MKLFNIFKNKEKETDVFHKKCCSDPHLVYVESTSKSGEEITREVEEKYNVKISDVYFITGACNCVCINCGTCFNGVKKITEYVEKIAENIIKTNKEKQLAEKIWSENCKK